MEYNLIPLHDTDPGKVRRLADSMRRKGWVGAPVVVDGAQAITGTHRIAAAILTATPIEAVELRDLFELAGLDMDDLHAQNGSPTFDEPDFVFFLEELPLAIRQEYGIDLR